MTFRVCKCIIEINVKVYVAMDEPTIVDLIKLPDQTAKPITDHLLKFLTTCGFNHIYFHNNPVCFTCDGTSVILGRKSGVAQRPQQMYHAIILGYAISKVHGVDNLHIFMNKLYSFYRQFPKGQNEIASTLNEKIKKNGHVLGVRWVTSLFRTISAVWKSYSSLCCHVESASNDTNRSQLDQDNSKGLYKRVSSKPFVMDLELMHDSLQRQYIHLVYADKLVRRTMRFLDSMKKCKAENAVKEIECCSVKLIDNNKVVSFNHSQFLTSIINNMKRRLFSTTSSHELILSQPGSTNIIPCKADIISELSIVETSEWPAEIHQDYG
uniref:Uncharacterized protein n=1 Tax=Timema monikensis TaxID=170555 RepID=A0A7R9HUB9_9NEOP|nr:unnamed protein product [Timema monikensis]